MYNSLILILYTVTTYLPTYLHTYWFCKNAKVVDSFHCFFYCFFFVECLLSLALLGTDSVVSEKATQLCTACELPSPNLFVMPYVDRPEGYVNR